MPKFKKPDDYSSSKDHKRKAYMIVKGNNGLFKLVTLSLTGKEVTAVDYSVDDMKPMILARMNDVLSTSSGEIDFDD